MIFKIPDYMHPDPDERITIIDIRRRRIIEYQHESHFAVFEYDGANGSKNITRTLSEKEVRGSVSTARCILMADDDEFEPYE